MRQTKPWTVALLAGILAGCAKTPVQSTSPTTVSISGRSSAGPIEGTVSVLELRRAADGGVEVGASLGEIASDAQGVFAGEPRRPSADAIGIELRSTGTYTDEASGKPQTVSDSAPLRTWTTVSDFLSNHDGKEFGITPLSEATIDNIERNFKATGDFGAAVDEGKRQVGAVLGVSDPLLPPESPYRNHDEGPSGDENHKVAEALIAISRVKVDLVGEPASTGEFHKALREQLATGALAGKDKDGNPILVGGVPLPTSGWATKLGEARQNFYHSEHYQSGAFKPTFTLAETKAPVFQDQAPVASNSSFEIAIGADGKISWASQGEGVMYFLQVRDAAGTILQHTQEGGQSGLEFAPQSALQSGQRIYLFAKKTDGTFVPAKNSPLTVP